MCLFLGFGIESIDSFSFVNCVLPQSLPLSVILHRTSSIKAINFTSKNNSESTASNQNYKAFNEAPEISKVRSLAITSKESVSVEQLNILLMSLESLEQLKLSQFKLNDIVNLTATALFDKSEELINVNNETKHFNTSEKTRLVLDENILNFGQSFPNLKVLRLQSFINELVPGLLFDMLNGLTKLEYLELDSNNLASLPEKSFSYAGNSLKKLYLYKNSLNNLDLNAFANLTRLEILDLSHNELTELSPNILKELKNLRYFCIKNNLLAKLPENLFESNTELSSIDLSSNRKLVDFPVDLLNGLQRLANFSAAYCRLTHLSESPQTFFRSAPNLESIEIQGNLIRNLTINGLFSGNPKLTKLDLSFNNISKMSRDIFSTNSSHIIELNFYHNEINSLPENLFAPLRNLRKLNLGFNKLRETSPHLFLPLKNLEELNLSKNKITTINSKQNPIPFGLGPKLREVNLANNELSNFESDFNSINWSLYLNIAELDLRFNEFVGKLRVPVFSSSIAPIINLDLSSNKITTVDVQDIISYDSLSLDNNSEFKVGETRRTRDSTSIKTNIWETHIRLDNNPINCDCFLEPFLSYAKTALISSSYPSRSSETTYRKTIFLIDSSDELVCNKPDRLKNYPLDSLELSQLICQIEDQNVCPPLCDCTYRSSDKIAVIDCDRKGLQSLPQELVLSKYHNISLAQNSTIETVSGVVLQLRHNQIKNIENISLMFIWGNSLIKRPSFVEIYLDNNSIVNVHEDIIPHFYSYKNNSLSLIKVLSLTHNQISSVPLSVLKNFDSIAFHLNKSDPKLYLGDNPYNCHNEKSLPGSECQIRDFKSWLTSHYERVGDINSIKCDTINYNSSSVIAEIPDEVLCPTLHRAQNDKLLLTLTIVCILLACSLFVVSVLYYRNKQTVLAFIYIHFNPIFICLSFSEHDLDEDKIYDAFVSYSSADRDVVMQLIEKLERPNNEANLILQNTTGASIHEGLTDQIIPENEFKKSQMNLSVNHNVIQSSGVEESNNNYFNLCIHERDWLPGNLISWNIVNSVQNSKRTILVLSKDFIQSIWFQVEFHTAYYQMLEDKIDRLIVVVKGPLPPKEELDKDLVFLLTTKTYLVWGEKWFWEKLRYALPHKKINYDFKSVESATNAHLNGVTPNKYGITNKSSEVMKDYVDKTIANHFQLNSSSHSNKITKNPPKSLRNSSQLSQINSKLKNGFENQSFVIETQT